MIVANLDERRRRQSATFDQILAVGERNHIVGAAMQNHCAGLHRRGSAVFPPCRAKQHEPGFAALDVHGQSAAPARADDDLRLVGVEFGLSYAHCCGEILVIERRVDDLAAMPGKVGRLHTARHGIPTVKEENSHSLFSDDWMSRSTATEKPPTISPTTNQMAASQVIWPPGGRQSIFMFAMSAAYTGSTRRLSFRGPAQLG